MKNINPLHPGGIEMTLDEAYKAGLRADDKLLDIGCGTGISLKTLQGKFDIDPYGIDISADVLKIAADVLITGESSGNEGHLFCCDASCLSFPDSSFDAVLMECVLTLLDDPASALREASRVLKHGGKFMLSTLVKVDPDTGVPVNDGSDIADIMTDDGLADSKLLTAFMNELGFKLIGMEDRKKDLTHYIFESIMDYGCLEARIAAETALTGASVFECGCSCDPKSVSYYSFIFTKL